MKMRKSGQPLTEAVIAEFEEQLNMKLPQDYKEFMLEHNGGRPEDECAFDFVETGHTEATSSLILRFRAISDEYGELKRSYTALIESELAPSNFLPIAIDPGGNLIMMSVSGKNYGAVCFGDHELADPETGYLVMSFIADSFSSFIDQCYIPDDDGL